MVNSKTANAFGSAIGTVAASAVGIAAAYSMTFVFFAAVCAFRTEGVDDCVLRYARELNAGTATGGYSYVLPNGERHIESDYFDGDVRSTVRGCMQASLVDATYCEVARRTEPIHYLFTK